MSMVDESTNPDYIDKDFPFGKVFIDDRGNVVKVDTEGKCRECNFFTGGVSCRRHPLCRTNDRADRTGITFKKIGDFKEYNKVEFPINSEFYIRSGHLLRVVPCEKCDGCFLEEECYNPASPMIYGHPICSKHQREDSTAVIFKSV